MKIESGELFEKLMKDKAAPVSPTVASRFGLTENKIVLITSGQKNVAARYRGGYFTILPELPEGGLSGISSRDFYQYSAFSDLLDKQIAVTAILGKAGTGKTTISLAYAIHMWMKEKKRIVLTKPAVTVTPSKAFGPVPGDIDEKYEPYLMSYLYALEKILGPKSGDQIKLMRSKGAIRFVPLEMLRGTEFSNCTFILDEAQNMNWHEMKTTLSRVHSSSKAIVLGDLGQIDIKLGKTSTGLYKLIHSKPYQQSPLSSTVELQRQYRSSIVELLLEVEKSFKK